MSQQVSDLGWVYFDLDVTLICLPLISPSRFGHRVEHPKSTSTQPRSETCWDTLYTWKPPWLTDILRYFEPTNLLLRKCWIGPAFSSKAVILMERFGLRTCNRPSPRWRACCRWWGTRRRRRSCRRWRGSSGFIPLIFLGLLVLFRGRWD